jgi:ABC-type proline/glycine betaine transport system substrate-binding protein
MNVHASTDDKTDDVMDSFYEESRCVLFIFSPTWFFWTFLMAYSKTRLKSSGDRASPPFRPFWIRKLSNISLPICFV